MKMMMMCCLAVVLCGCTTKQPDKIGNEGDLDMDVSRRAQWLDKTEGLENVDFDIPKSLLTRMYEAHNAARGVSFNITNAFDAEEMFGLANCGMTNADEIVARPRGEMKFCCDLLTEEERAEIWPFDVEAFESELEAKMVRDDDGLYRLRPETAEEGAVKEDGLVASNPTIRWVNYEMEQWAIRQMDAKFNRVDEETFCKMAGADELPEDVFAWDMGNEEYFVIIQRDGAWNPRDYMFVLWRDGDDPCVVASLDSFPNRKEGVAIRGWRYELICVNNVAVLEWQHRSRRLSMNPWNMAQGLAIAAEEGLTIAEYNLKVLMDHIPEASDFFVVAESGDKKDEEE
jgi:hypothetical protein